MANLDQIMDCLADNFNKKITTENLTATTGSSAISGYYYGDISTDTTDIISAIPYEVTSNRFTIAEIISTTTLRVWSIAASTTVKVRVTRIAQ